MSYVSIEVWDTTGSKKTTVDVPDDVPTSRIIVKLVERLNYPKNDPTGGQLLSYKLHHYTTKRQLVDDQTLAESGVGDGDVVRLVPEITAGGGG